MSRLTEEQLLCVESKALSAQTDLGLSNWARTVVDNAPGIIRDLLATRQANRALLEAAKEALDLFQWEFCHNDGEVIGGSIGAQWVRDARAAIQAAEGEG